jgi:hypothetical protein
MTEQTQPAPQSLAQHTSMKEMKGHTREGPTSGIIMNGMGPNPMAKDLGNRVSGENRAAR